MILPGFTPIEVGGPTNPVGIVLTILEFLASLFGLGQGNLKVMQSAINNTYQNLVLTSAFLYNGLGFLSGSIKNIFGTIKDWLDDLRWAVIVPIIEKIEQVIDDITTWLADFLDPIITFVNNVMAWFNKYILPIVKATLEVIQRMRVFLALLKLIGVKWAAKLDADLQLVQSYLTAFVQQVTATLNTISTVLGLMVDPTGILRRDFFGGTLFSSLAGVKRAASAGNDRISTPAEQKQIDQNNALIEGGKPFGTMNADGSITYKPGMAPVIADVNAGFASIGVTVPGH